MTAFPKPVRVERPRKHLQRRNWIGARRDEPEPPAPLALPKPARRPPKQAKPLRQNRKPKRPPGWDIPAYRKAVAAEPCCCPLTYHGPKGTPEWRGDVVPHHPRLIELRAGAGLKCPDQYVIPLAKKCHDDLHAKRGAFAGWSDGFMREWQLRQVGRVQARLGWKAPGAVAAESDRQETDKEKNTWTKS